jgi:hypothetical protein
MQSKMMIVSFLFYLFQEGLTSMFTERELKVKEFIEASYVPAIHEMMAKGDPLTYVRYGGRCCKQIAYLLKLFLNKALPEYEWTAWESIFLGDFEDYSHAWVFGRHKTIRYHHIIMDYGKLSNEYSFFLRTERNEYPSYLEAEDENSFPWYLDEEDEESRRELLPKGKETFTRRTFDELYQELEEKLNIEQFIAKLSS